MVCEMTSQEGGCTPPHNQKNAAIGDSALKVSPFSKSHPFLLCALVIFSYICIFAMQCLFLCEQVLSTVKPVPSSSMAHTLAP
jgi:hypothetical protein